MTLDDIVQAVRAAHDSHTPLRIRGAGSKDFYGGMLSGEVLSVAAYRGIVAYEPTELYITARCGTPLAEVEAALAGKGQMLACEPPHFSGASAGSAGATVGGCVAAGLSGPRRQQAGAVRDFMLGLKLVIVLLANGGYGCINRLQQACGGAEFNNMYKDSRVEVQPEIDFVAHAASMGAVASKVASIAELETALAAARESTVTTVIVIDTDPYPTPDAGGHFWDVAVPEVSPRAEVNQARARYEAALKERH